MPAISSISPVSGAPGTVIALVGSGFSAASQVGCPSLVPTTYVVATDLQATIPAMEGPAGSSITIGIFVIDSGNISNVVTFAVTFPVSVAQAWTTIDQVCGEVPSFLRGNAITDDSINRWIQSISQSVTAMLLRRGLPLDPTQWAQPSANTAAPTAAATLELVTRYGAAARLAGAIASQFGSGTSGIQVALQKSYDTEFKLLESGAYDKLFMPAASTEITQVSIATQQQLGEPTWPAFRKGKVF